VLGESTLRLCVSLCAAGASSDASDDPDTLARRSRDQAGMVRHLAELVWLVMVLSEESLLSGSWDTE
jgi:hypothetical protein